MIGTMTVTPDVVESLATPDGLVKLTDITRTTGIPRSTIQGAIVRGVITPTGVRRGHGGSLTFTKEDAALIIAAAALALLLGVAFVTLLRTMKEAGAQVSGSQVTINLPGGAK